MPNRPKRRLEDFDPNKSDSADSDYDVSAARPRPTRSSKPPRSKPPARKRQRTGYGGDASEDVSESEGSQESFDEADDSDEPPDLDPVTGRPRRAARKKQVVYEESDGNSIDFMNEVDSAAETASPRKRSKQVAATKKSLVVKLQMTPASLRRSARARSQSVPTKRPRTSDGGTGVTRRSSRISHDDTEPMLALTNSGNHAQTVRAGTKSPDRVLQRVRVGGKGLKKPPSAIFEAEDESSGRTKEEPGQVPSHSLDDIEQDASQDNLIAEDSDEEGASDKTEKAPQNALTETAVVPESEDEGGANPQDGDDEDEDDEDDQIIKKPRRRDVRQTKSPNTEEVDDSEPHPRGASEHRALRSAATTARSTQKGRKGVDDTSDFEPAGEEGAEENVSSSSESEPSPRKASQENGDSSTSGVRRSARGAKNRTRSRRRAESEERDSEEADEIAEELHELQGARPRRRGLFDSHDSQRPQTRKRKPVDYRILRPDLALPLDDDGLSGPNTSSRRARGGAGAAWQRSLYSTYGPFGGAGGPLPLFGGPGAAGAAGALGAADSDSSDDDRLQRARPTGFGGMIGMTPTGAAPPGFGSFPTPQTHGNDPLQTSFGKIKDKQALADADPLGVDQNVNFDGVGGLEEHINQLKEMVALPLLYPELFQRFKVTPPRGVLFHGPPGTGKTLMARALATSVSTEGKKVTFYMRKGADALSKWVGEAERQLRLLFEEARRTQPSIIFFDEIDGLAPVRSSKQDQIHSSIVSTLLALMDGMDGRGQVVVIGATNRPDSVDPALRRPGRFDREFYFPLPGRDARRAILEIHTKNWNPPISSALKDELAEVTKGYGGADLRALCTEAALNAVQRRYPQIYTSKQKLLIKPETITIAAKDFMISLKKMVPSSERSASSGASPLPKSVEPLLRAPLQQMEKVLADVLPRKKQLTALEEAQFEDAATDRGMFVERMQQEFETSRIFRPRLLVRGASGMGQNYIAGALLHHFEGLHVQSFDLPKLLSDSTHSMEAVVVQLFAEVKRHKPSVIYIPNVDLWYKTISSAAISTFLGMLKSLAPTEPVLVLGVMECDDDSLIDQSMLKNLFGFSRRNQFLLGKPDHESRKQYFEPIIEYIGRSPEEFPDPADRKMRVFEDLPVAPPEPPKPPVPPTKEEIKAQKKKDRQMLNILKLRIQPIMDQIKMKFKIFRSGVIDDNSIRYLYDEEDQSKLTSDLPQEQMQAAATFRPYEKSKDERGEPGLREQASSKFFYNMEIVTIEKRLSNGYYKRPKDFLADIKKIAKDARAVEDPARLVRANELQANVEVDIGNIETETPTMLAEYEALYLRELQREKDKIDKIRQAAASEGRVPSPIISNVPPKDVEASETQSSGAIVLGQRHANGILHNVVTPLRQSHQSTMTNGISDLSNLEGHRESNGTSHLSREDVHMANMEEPPSAPRYSQDSSFGPSAQTRPAHFHTGAPISLQARMSLPGSLSQRSAVTPMAEGSNPHMYANSASTTSSDKRKSASSNPSLPTHTQSTPIRIESQDLRRSRDDFPDVTRLPMPPPSANADLPDTQPAQGSPPSSSQNFGKELSLTPGLDRPYSQASVPKSSQSQPSQPPVPAFPRSSTSAIHDLLNTSPLHPPLMKDTVSMREFLDDLVERTAPCSVEQLEQVYSALMNEIWRTRGNWNRNNVVDDVRSVLQDVLYDMEECQDLDTTNDFEG